MIESFEDLECYKACRLVRLEAAKFTKTLPKDERYRLIDQMIRASRSTTANIAEGFGRHHHQENLQYLRQARGSLFETLEHYNTCFDEGFISVDDYRLRREEIETAIKILNGFIRYIQSCAQSKVDR